ncbi:MAG: response regulator, partial [Proteobacteria bacterium]|nr:response regulator [Pseudomonadota bacterium]
MASTTNRTDKVLVVDDDARIRDLLRRYLTQEGFEVMVAEDGKALNRILLRETVDLIVLDLMMPGEDGLSICRRLRAASDRTPIIMLTAKGEDVDRIVGLEVGADDYLGKPFNPRELLARIRASDLLLVLGGRLSEIPSQGYELLSIPNPTQPLVHVHADADELGSLYRPAQAIHATPQAMAAALAGMQPMAAPVWAAHTQAARAEYLAWSDPAPIRIPGSLQMGEVMQHLRQVLPADTIFCNGAGNFATWVHRFWPFTAYGSQLAPTSGSMGYGLPAGVGAKRLWPQREVVVFAGDGDFLMHGQEFATAVQYGLPLVVVLLDNAMYGTIRMHQEREYPGRISATALKNPDFKAYAQAFGGHGERVERTEDFAPALARAR